MPPVLIRIENDLPSPQRVEGVAVEFYSTGGTFLTSGMTDSSGEVEVLLPEAFYDVRFFKLGVSILPKQPQRIEVGDPSLVVNEFLVVSHVKTRPESIDPIKCRVSGIMLRSDGAKTKTRIVFAPVLDLLVFGDVMVVPRSQVDASSDEDGYFEFDLLRGVKYTAYFVYLDVMLGMCPAKLDVVVPNLPGVEINQLLFPLPANVTFTESALSLIADGDVDDSVSYSIVYSDSSTRPCQFPWASVRIVSSDEDVAEVGMFGTHLCITPKAPGTALITAIRTIGSVAFWNPEPVFSTETLTVTVS